MKLTIAAVTQRKKNKTAPAHILTLDYVERARPLCPTDLLFFDSEAALLAAAQRRPGRAGATLLLFDSRGDTLSSEQFAELLGRLRDDGAQSVWLAVGPADGWSHAALAHAQRILSLGRMTLPHELARVLVAEQVYRAFTILARHPYHTGH